MPLNLGQVARAIKDSAAGATKLFNSFKNVNKGIDDIIRWGQNNGFKLTSYKNAEALKKDMPSLFDAYQNRGFNSFKASVQKELGEELTTDEVNYLARHEKQNLWNKDWNGRKSRAIEHRDKYVEKFRQDRYNAHQAELKAGADYGGGFSNSELDDLYDSSIGEIVPPSGSGYNKYRAEQLRQQYNANFDAQLNQAEKNLEYKAKNSTDPLLASMSEASETPVIAKYNASQSENLNALLSSTGDESIGHAVSDAPEITSMVAQSRPAKVRIGTNNRNAAGRSMNGNAVEWTGEEIKGPVPINTALGEQFAEDTVTEATTERVFNVGKGEFELKTNKKIVPNYDYASPDIFKLKKPQIDDNAQWANGMKIALGTAVTGAALCAALSASRGQQNNAQLYGQQPLY